MGKMSSKVKLPVRVIAKKNPALRKLMRAGIYCWRRAIYMLRGLGVKTDDKIIVFESFNGKNYSCSPKAIYQYMKEAQDFKDYQFIWIFKEPEKYNELLNDDRTKIVKFRSAECEKMLARAKFWVFNYRALEHWVPKKEQIYIQCWHGTPLKKLGYDIEKSDNAMNSIEEIRDKYYRDAKKFKYLVSPCRFATEKFKTAWNLKSIGKENAIIESGYPRNDFLINYTEEDVWRIKEKLNLTDIDKKILLYAPTWRDNQHSVSLGYTYEAKMDFAYLKKKLEEEYIILFRAHYLVANSFEFKDYQGFVYDVSAVDDINELYVISDILITDYSSVFFDYAILKRPIIFYMYDMERYRDEIRGFYLGLEELPGKVVMTEQALIEEIKSCDKESNEDEFYKFNKKFNYLNDGKASERLLKVF